MTTEASVTTCDGCDQPITEMSQRPNAHIDMTTHNPWRNLDFHNTKCLRLYLSIPEEDALNPSRVQEALQEVLRQPALNHLGAVTTIRSALALPALDDDPTPKVLAQVSVKPIPVTVPVDTLGPALVKVLDRHALETFCADLGIPVPAPAEDAIRAQVADAEASSRLAAGVFGHDPEMSDRTGGVG